MNEMTTQSFSRLHSRARKLAKTQGTRWAASFLMAHGYTIERTLRVLFTGK